jgi:hypothetical protein
MQLFSAATIFFAHENIEKLPSKVAYFSWIWAGYTTANQPKASLNLKYQ